MNIENEGELQYLIDTMQVVVDKVEHKFEENKLIITYRKPCHQMLMSNPPQKAPDTLYKVEYTVEGTDLTIGNISKGTVKQVPAYEQIVWT